MNLIEKKISLNVSQPNDFELLCAMQGDNETIKITAKLYDTNQSYIIDDSITDIVLQGVTPSGMAILNDITEYTTSTVSFKLTNNMLSQDGNLKLSVVMIDSKTDEILSTFPFVIRVVNAPIGEIQESELNSITKYVLKAKDYADNAENSAQNAQDSYQKLENQKGKANGIAQLDENAKVVLEQLPQASLTGQGITQLTDSVTSNSATTAATPNSVKQTYDAVATEKNRAISAENALQATINSNKPNWDDKYTRNEIDNKFSSLETSIDWKEAVATFDDIATTYPVPEDGWTVNVKDMDYTYRFNGSEWIVISANAIPKATSKIDGLFTKEDKTKLDGIASKIADIQMMEPTEFIETITYTQDSSTQIEDTGSSIEYLVYEKVIESAENFKDLVISADSVTYTIEAGTSSGNYINISLNLYVNEDEGEEILVYSYQTAGEDIEITEDGFEFSANYLDYSSLTFPCTIRVKAIESYVTYQAGTVTARTGMVANPENMMLKYTADAPKTRVDMADTANISLKAIQDGNGNIITDTYLPTTNVVNNLTTTASGYALDARQGNSLSISISNISKLYIKDILFPFDGINFIRTNGWASESDLLGGITVLNSESFLVVQKGNSSEIGSPYGYKMLGRIKLKATKTGYITSDGNKLYLPFTCGKTGSHTFIMADYMPLYNSEIKISSVDGNTGSSFTGMSMKLTSSTDIRDTSSGSLVNLSGYFLNSGGSSIPITSGDTYIITFKAYPMVYERTYIKY